MSLEQLMALAGHLAQMPQMPRSVAYGPTVPSGSRVSLSQAELEALRDIWSTPLRSQMGQRAHMSHTAELKLPGSTAKH